MKTYQSHKVVQAAKIAHVRTTYDPKNDIVSGVLVFDDGGALDVDGAWLAKHAPDLKRVESLVGGYLVRYEDGYHSWSPAETFEGGYVEVTEAGPLTEELRVIDRSEPDGPVTFGIYRTQVDSKGLLVSFDPVEVFASDGVPGLCEVMRQLSEAIQKPVLLGIHFPPQHHQV